MIVSLITIQSSNIIILTSNLIKYVLCFRSGSFIMSPLCRRILKLEVSSVVVKSSEAFYEAFFSGLSFSAKKQDGFTIYQNAARPEHGFIVRYSKRNYYDIFLGDYTIPEDFGITFNNPSVHMRFGMVYSGVTKFRLINEAVSSFTPSSFFVVENHPKGRQVWHKGQHFHGTEVTIYKPYFEEVICPAYGDACVSLEEFKFNITYRYLPLELLKVLHQIERLSEAAALNILQLDSKILECLALITAEYRGSSKNAFTDLHRLRQITLGQGRRINLSEQDTKAIRKAYEIMTDQACSPPTIEHLSTLVGLNSQKLKAGFLAIYHTTIWEYANTIRMSMAANLLMTTDMSIKEIAEKVGYAHTANFINRFKETYHTTPNKFRKTKD